MTDFRRFLNGRVVLTIGLLGAGAPALAAQPAADTVWRIRRASDSLPDADLRWRLLRHNTFTSPGAIARSVFPALAGQAFDSPKEWNSTFGGFGRRLGSRAAVVTSRDVLQAGTAAAFGHDPRYQRCECVGVLRRAGHAFAGVFMLSDARGEGQPDPSNVVSAIGSGFVSASLYPGSGSHRQRVVRGAALMLGQQVIEHTVLEFAPDIRSWLRRRRN